MYMHMYVCLFYVCVFNILARLQTRTHTSTRLPAAQNPHQYSLDAPLCPALVCGDVGATASIKATDAAASGDPTSNAFADADTAAATAAAHIASRYGSCGARGGGGWERVGSSVQVRSGRRRRLKLRHVDRAALELRQIRRISRSLAMSYMENGLSAGEAKPTPRRISGDSADY